VRQQVGQDSVEIDRQKKQDSGRVDRSDSTRAVSRGFIGHQPQIQGLRGGGGGMGIFHFVS
jgi:hypothetical protein